MSSVPPPSPDAPNQYSPTAGPPAGPSEYTWAMLCHLTALSAYIGVPLGNILGPLIFWLIKKDQMPLVDDQGKESLNFQISVTIYAIVAGLLILVLIGFVLIIALVIFHIVFTVIGSVKASQGVAYRYPLCIRLIR